MFPSNEILMSFLFTMGRSNSNIQWLSNSLRHERGERILCFTSSNN